MRHGTTRRVSFPAVGIDGHAQEQTGLVHVPRGPAPASGFPVVAYGHMTTGGGPRSAPSTADAAHPEWRRMSQGDALCDALLARGIAVLRPDYEGIGGPGIHPYLIGRSLAESTVAMVRSRASFGEALGDAWLAAGHSEGAVGALWASTGSEPDERSRLVGTAAFAPVTRMDLSIRWALRMPLAVPGTGVVSALIGLMLRGAATVDDRLAELVAGPGLGARARALWPELGERCLTELAARSSWGGLAPGALLGGAGREVRERLFASFRENEVAALRGFRAPVRIDAAAFDEVAPAALTRALLRGYAGEGVALTARWWPTHHSGTMHARFAPSEAAAWIAARFPAPAP